MATTTASNVAKYLVRHFCDQGQPISNLKLQKLLYYCQGWHLGMMRSALFSDRVEAWVHGPVIPNIFQEYRHYGWSPIMATSAPVEFDEISTAIVNNVIEEYGKWSAAQLEQLSHAESPWSTTRGTVAANVGTNREISQLSMMEFFSS